MDTGSEAIAPTDSIDTGAGDVASSAEGFTTEPAADAVSTDGGESPQLYTIKVDGQEQQVTLEELQSGYQRQADYTRKTQEIAKRAQRLSQAEALAVALERDPHGTLEALQQAYGYQAPAAQPTGFDGYEAEELDPLEQKVLELEAQLRRQTLANQQAQVANELDALRAEVGDDFSDVDVLSYAVKNGMASLRDAYFAMKGPELYSTVRTLSAKEREEQEAIAAKRALAPIEGGSSRSGTTSAPKVNSFRDAWRLAATQGI